MNQRELEDRGESSCDILKQQLAAEKARADKLEAKLNDTQDELREAKAELAHALDMVSQADVCCGLLRARAEKAEAACAEMRNALQAVYDDANSPEAWKLAIDALRSSDCGKGWLSPETRKLPPRT